jgi:hypothetical protein
MYDKLAGMTGTALTEADEFDIYGLTVVEVPTNRADQRIDEDDEVYRTAEEKYIGDPRADIEDCQASAASRCWSAPPRSRSRKCWAEHLRKERLQAHRL